MLMQVQSSNMDTTPQSCIWGILIENGTYPTSLAPHCEETSEQIYDVFRRDLWWGGTIRCDKAVADWQLKRDFLAIWLACRHRLGLLLTENTINCLCLILLLQKNMQNPLESLCLISNEHLLNGYPKRACGGDYARAVLQNEKHLVKFQSLYTCLQANMQNPNATRD